MKCSYSPFPRANRVIPAILGESFSFSDRNISGGTKKLSTFKKTYNSFKITHMASKIAYCCCKERDEIGTPESQHYIPNRLHRYYTTFNTSLEIEV